MHPSIETYAAREYRSPGDLAVAMHQSDKPETPPSPFQAKYGTIFQRVIRPFVGFRANIFDRTEFPVGERIEDLGGMARLFELGILGQIAITVVRELTSGTDVNVALGLVPLVIASAQLYAMSHRDKIRKCIENFGLHPSRELGLIAHPLTEGEIITDTQLCIGQLNTIGPPELANFDKASIIRSVQKSVQEIYRFDAPTTSRPKRSRRSKPNANDPAGNAYSLTGEIVLSGVNEFAATAHETAHTLGIRKESEAQLLAIVSMINSGNSGLQYLGYMEWLLLLTSIQAPKWFRPSFSGNKPYRNKANYVTLLCDKFREMGLHDMQIENARKLWGLDLPFEKEKSPWIDDFMHQKPALFARPMKALRAEMSVWRMRSDSRRKNDHLERYAEIPVQLLHNYRAMGLLNEHSLDRPIDHTNGTPH